VPWPGRRSDRACPILVCGSSDDTVRAAAERLERQGLAAWQVTGRSDGQTSTGAGAAV